MIACPGCARELPSPEFPFCPWCGHPLDGEPSSGQRKTVSVLFADLVDSTGLGSSVDPEVLRGVLGEYWEHARSVVESHGGTVEKFIGDAVVGVFGVPTVHEDDALRATRAAVEVVAAVGAVNRRHRDHLGVDLRVRVGVNSGEVFTGGGVQTLMSGDAANVAARLQSTAAPDQVVIGEETYRLVRQAALVESLGPLSLKGKSEPVVAYRVLSVHPVAPGRRRRRFSGPMLGRQRQLSLARTVFATVEEGGSSALLTVVGEPGVGKSRLVDELVASIGDGAAVLSGGCLPYGEGITYAPLAEMVSTLEEPDGFCARLLAGVDHADRIVAGLGALRGASTATVPEMLWSFRRVVELLSDERPVVVIIDDLQWAETPLVELARDLVLQLRHRPVLVVVMARPALLSVVPSWPSVPTTTATLVLSPLSVPQSRELAASLLGPAVSDELALRVSEAAEGIPLFVEEIVAMLVDERALVADGSGGWAVEGNIVDVPVPATVRALLAARIDQLPQDERDVIEAAAVLGRTVARDAVAHLVTSGVDVDRGFEALSGADLLQPAASDLPGRETFRFTHSLTAETAYASLPKNRRVTLHLRAARWLSAELDETSSDGVVAFHLEQAVTYQQELGISDDETRNELSGILVRLSRRAGTAGDAVSALRLAERAVATRPASVEAWLAQSRAAWMGGDVAGAQRAVEQAQHEADGLGEADSAAGARVAIWREWLRSVVEEEDPDAMLRVADRAAPALVGDDAGLSEMYALRADAFNVLGLSRQRGEEAMAALAHEMRLPAGSRRLADLVSGVMIPLLFGEMTLAEGEQRLAQLEVMVGEDPVGQWGLTWARHWMLACRGDIDEALLQMQEHADLLLEQGSTIWAAEVLGSGMAWSYTWTGRLPQAVDVLTRAADLKGEVGEVGMRSTWLSELAVLLARLRRIDEARAALDELESIRPAQDVATDFLAGTAQVLVAAAEGDDDRAFLRLAQQAQQSAPSDLFSRAHAEIALAQAASWLGDTAREDAALREALRLVEVKGCPPPIQYVRSLLDAPAATRWLP